MIKGDETKIYVVCLAAYNAGNLHGAWIDANQDPYDIWDEVSVMLTNSPVSDAEEWAIHDYDGFGGASISEYESFESVSKKAVFIAEHGALGAQLLSYYADIEEAETAIEEHYAGQFESLSDFAREITEQCGQEVPDNLAYYIDYDAMGRDMAISDVLTLETAPSQVHVFWQH